MISRLTRSPNICQHRLVEVGPIRSDRLAAKIPAKRPFAPHSTNGLSKLRTLDDLGALIAR